MAVVALARRLAGILYALLRDGSVFKSSAFGILVIVVPLRLRSPLRRCDRERVNDALPMRALFSRRFDGWVSANVASGPAAGPLRRWRPHSNALLR